MKNAIAVFLFGFCLIFGFALAATAQYTQFDYKSGGLRFTLPDDWVAREHILLLLMPKSEEIQIEIEALDAIDLSEAIELSAIELKAIFPQDTSFNVEENVINKMPFRKIDKSSGDTELIVCFFKTPDKIVRLKCLAEKSLVQKNKSVLSKIITSTEPLK